MEQRTEVERAAMNALEWIGLYASMVGVWAVPTTEGAMPNWTLWVFAVVGLAAGARILYRVIRVWRRAER